MEKFEGEATASQRDREVLQDRIWGRLLWHEEKRLKPQSHLDNPTYEPIRKLESFKRRDLLELRRRMSRIAPYVNLRNLGRSDRDKRGNANYILGSSNTSKNTRATDSSFSLPTSKSITRVLSQSTFVSRPRLPRLPGIRGVRTRLSGDRALLVEIQLGSGGSRHLRLCSSLQPKGVLSFFATHKKSNTEIRSSAWAVNTSATHSPNGEIRRVVVNIVGSNAREESAAMSKGAKRENQPLAITNSEGSKDADAGLAPNLQEARDQQMCRMMPRAPFGWGENRENENNLRWASLNLEQTETTASRFQGESKDKTELSAVLTPRQRTPNATRPGCSCKVGAPATLSLRQPRRSRNIAASRNAVTPPLLRSATLPQSRIDG
ncbi:hypothetical protein SISNIDRAFT_469555 [Sistotremastrum niveocremeum HHB9708]|uniref:Uncharacterized protein n=1 Tax=Sistotremastrum niveocremeum HHB9708 TaxID=1314777 RepID=A0A164PUC4_9AGAM|nr:hypothetical protein SISNIDRAFT_469555 [Sistotremastrum niveocremeum HHB9708]